MKYVVARRFFVCFLCGLLFIFSFSFVEADEKKQSTIIGYGPIAGDLIKPSSSVVSDGKLYVLDQTGISVFDLETQKLIDKHHASYQMDILSNVETVKDLCSYHYGLTRSLPLNYSPIGESLYSSIYTNQPYYVQPAMCLDSNQNLYIASQDGIHVLSIESMTPNTILSYPKEILEPEKDTTINIITMKLYNDQLFLLKTVYYIYQGQLSNTFYQLDLNGNIVHTFQTLFDEENYSDIVEPDFIYIQPYDLYGMTYTIHDYWKREENPNPHPILWFNSKGENIPIANQESFPNFFSRIEYNPTTQNILLTGRDYELEETANAHFTLFSMRLEKVNNDFQWVLESSEQKETFGQECMDIFCCDDDIILISLGQFYEAWNYRVYRVTDSSIDQYGTTSNRLGQIHNSMSFCIDTQGTLYTHNNGQIFLNVFATDGTWKDTLDLDYELITMKWWNIANSTILSDLSLQGDNLVFVNALPNTVTEYSLLDETWNQLYKGDITKPYFWSNIQYIDSQYLVLFPRYWLEDSPHVYKVADVLFMDDVKDFKVNDLECQVSPLFVGFNINMVHHDQKLYPQYQFLDCVHQAIWIYDHQKRLQEIVQLPQNENSLYSSFDLYPDGSWIVTDVTQHRLLHIARNGKILETIGSKGRVNIGTTKEAYLEKPDQFYFPVRAKIVNNHIYVADFGNCRYHKIPIGVPSQSIPSSKLVEVGLLGSMTPYKSQFPLLQLENGYPNIDAISFEPSFSTFNPSPYCFQYYEEVRKFMQLDRGYPQTICQRTKYYLGVPKNDVGDYDWSSWIPLVYNKTKDSSASTDIVLLQPHVECTEDSYTATAQLKWEEIFPMEDFENFRYSIFLKADRIYYYDYLEPYYSVENLAYDMIPLLGDVKEEYSSSGFPLFSSSEEYPTEKNLYFSITTEPFTLPFIEGFPKNQQPKWSLHLILNDSRDMRKNLYSWSFPIEIVEES